MSECQKCKKKPLNQYKSLVAIVSIYLLITSIIGTVTLFNILRSLF
jgi:hypothetical protein